MKLSIIIPMYNVEQYIEHCLISVTEQSMTEGVECILVNDCGGDNSIKIAETFIERYSGNVKFSIIHHEKNKGLSAARNSGIRVAKGKYLLFLDSDDFLLPHCLSYLFKAATENNAELVQGGYSSDSEYLKNLSAIQHPSFTDDRKYIMKTLLNYDVNPVMAQNRLVEKRLIVNNGIWFKEGIIHEDTYWTFFLAKHVKRMAFCLKETYFYRVTPGSITQHVNKEKETKAFFTLINDFTDNIDNFEKGAQKRYVFLNLLVMKKNGFIDSSKGFHDLVKKFLRKCSLLEAFLILISLNSKGFMHVKVVNLLQKLFILN